MFVSVLFKPFKNWFKNCWLTAVKIPKHSPQWLIFDFELKLLFLLRYSNNLFKSSLETFLFFSWIKVKNSFIEIKTFSLIFVEYIFLINSLESFKPIWPIEMLIKLLISSLSFPIIFSKVVINSMCFCFEFSQMSPIKTKAFFNSLESFFVELIILIALLMKICSFSQFAHKIAMK